ncbi:hypothetical protein K458DRAFT_423018 [Lentithecium fluviatile CBS 122367]|uniref:CENP-V/GFA domain-containing protein n=1 Tax=Lentithecium fluviatile CBS 122367 TaxID=1168545 RepID=A0A6G1IKQ5_9PLEO|nr:hypothetical protein K458DRAFT_423018 [Lentithecium fluviatile CBS 122367]
MAEGRCNCGSIRVSIPALPEQSAICYCANCKRAGSSSFSLVYLLNKSDVHIKDPNGALKNYQDKDTKSGNTLTRQFCANCGSPIASLMGPEVPKIILKAGLFDNNPAPGHAVFEEDRPEWLSITRAG